MNEQELFIKKLSGIDTFAAGKDGILTETEIQQYFEYRFGCPGYRGR